MARSIFVVGVIVFLAACGVGGYFTASILWDDHSPSSAPVVVAGTEPMAPAVPTMTGDAMQPAPMGVEPDASVAMDKLWTPYQLSEVIAGEDLPALEELVAADIAVPITADLTPIVSAPIADEGELVPRKVRTVTVRPDGTILSGDDAVAGAEALPEPGAPDDPPREAFREQVAALVEQGGKGSGPDNGALGLSDALEQEVLLARLQSRPLDPVVARQTPLGTLALKDPAVADYLWRVVAARYQLIAAGETVEPLDKRLAALAVPVKVAIEVNEAMEEGQTYEASVFIQINPATGDVEASAAFEGMKAATPEPTANEEVTSVVPDEVRATLVGALFQIEELKGDWQAIVGNTPSVWKWKVTPETSGVASLLFSVEQRVSNDSGVPLVLPAENYPKTIQIAVSPMRAWTQIWLFIRDNAGAIITVVGAALAAVVSYFQIVAYVRKRPNRTAPAAATATPAKPKAPRRRKAPAQQD